MNMGKRVLAILLTAMLSLGTITTPVIASDGYESDEISEERGVLIFFGIYIGITLQYNYP